MNLHVFNKLIDQVWDNLNHEHDQQISLVEFGKAYRTINKKLKWCCTKTSDIATAFSEIN